MPVVLAILTAQSPLGWNPESITDAEGATGMQTCSPRSEETARDFLASRGPRSGPVECGLPYRLDETETMTHPTGAA
ncbi:MAG: hypothetical protein KA250_09355 [Verrucomicrobiales bacterium]|nr:hypothetical protein [Verrucomicrobiales bacterium]MBP9226081.1 hypothetical protein [Verrucomicrobiales bacterium]HQZ27634.1 hypothetical protein [Verrucomicrobiales bacterium]